MNHVEDIYRHESVRQISAVFSVSNFEKINLCYAAQKRSKVDWG